MKLRSLIVLLILCSTVAAFGQQGVPHGSFFGHLFGYGFVFQVAAVIHWSRKRPDSFWLWIIIIGGIIGALAYFLIEGLPTGDYEITLQPFVAPSAPRRLPPVKQSVTVTNGVESEVTFTLDLNAKPKEGGNNE